jgi:hypothetical protein
VALMPALSNAELDLLEADMAVIERYRREPGREPGERTLLAFQRASKRIPQVVAEARAHLRECVLVVAPARSGYWITCRSIASTYDCDAEWLSHDLMTGERIHRHFADEHGYTEHLAFSTVDDLRARGLLP